MRRDLRFGIAWAAALLVVDSATSAWEIQRSLEKMSHDAGVTRIVQREVGIYLLQAMAAYAVVGAVVGLVLVAMNLAFRGGDPGRRRWLAAGLLTGWIWAHGAVRWPLMFNGIPGLDAWASTMHPGWVSAGFALLAIAFIAREARLHGFRPLPAAAGALLFGALLLADHVPAAPVAVKNQGPNVLLLSFDALRPDHLAFDGYPRRTTPRLDAFLEQASVFEAAFTPEARTWEAWMSVLTGAWPVSHGLRFGLPRPGEELPRLPTITSALRQAGWHTRFLTDDSRFSYMLPAHGWDAIDQPWVGIRAFAPSRYQPNFRVFFTFLNGPLGWRLAPVYRHNQAYGITYRHDAFAEQIARDLAAAAEHDRFLVAAHVCILHTPADRSWPYHTLWGMGEKHGSNRYRYRSFGAAGADGERVDAAELERLERADRQQNLDLYDAGLVMVDEVFARVQRALEDAGLEENTLVVVMSDHGEDFLEDSTRYRFRGPNHGFHPWGIGQHRVLLALRGPGFPAARRPELASLTDLAPTLARHAGIPFPTAEGLPLQDPLPSRILYGETGVSEKDYWPEGHKVAAYRRATERYTVDPTSTRVVFRAEYIPSTIEAKDRWAFDDQWWLVEEAMETGRRYSLFRWREDPTFAHDRIHDEPQVFARLRHALLHWPRHLGRPDLEVVPAILGAAPAR